MKYKIKISKNKKNIFKEKKNYHVNNTEISSLDDAIEASYTEKCKNNNEEYVSIEDLDRLINGMYLSDYSEKELGIDRKSVV